MNVLSDEMQNFMLGHATIVMMRPYFLPRFLVKYFEISVIDLLIFLHVYKIREIVWKNKSRKQPLTCITKVNVESFTFSNIKGSLLIVYAGNEELY